MVFYKYLKIKIPYNKIVYNHIRYIYINTKLVIRFYYLEK